MQRLLKSFSLVVIICSFLIIPLQSPVSAQVEIAELGIFESLKVQPRELIQVPVSVRNVQDLYGLDFTLNFDPEIVQVEDVDPVNPGIQAALGTFLDPGLLLFNVADNNQGSYHFVMSQYNPSVAKSGEGIIVVITFRSLKIGRSPLTIPAAQLSSRQGIEIPSRVVNSEISVIDNAPTQSATYKVADPTAVIDVNKITPHPTLIDTPVPTCTVNTVQLPTKITGASTSVPLENENSLSREYFLVRNWWIVVVLLVVVLGTGLYSLFRKKKY